MKTTHRPTSNRNAQTRENRQSLSIRMMIHKRRSHLRNRPTLHENTHANTNCHNQQRKTKNWIQLPNQRVNRQQRRKNIIKKNDDTPKPNLTHHTSTATQLRKQISRRLHKHRTHQNHQHQRKHQHENTHAIPQLVTNQLRKTRPTLTQTNHPTQIIMHRTTKNTTQNNPEKSSRTKQNTLNRTKNRTRASNIQKLNQKNLPRRHRHKIHTISPILARRRTLTISTENTLHNTAVEEKTKQQAAQPNHKTNHFSASLITNFLKLRATNAALP